MNFKELEKEILNSKKPVLLEIWSSWCLSCQAMKSTLEELEEDYKDKIKILKVNPDFNSAISSHYKVKGLPTFIFLKEGREIKREVGAKSKEELSKMIDEFFKNEEK
jgi:thioredoxin 1